MRKVRGGIMPPIGRPRPDEAAYDGFASWLETELDQAAAAHLNPGRTETFHRLNRAEYRNAIRDLLGLELDIVDFLPADNASYGFDNIAGVLRMSQSLMERYLAAARSISRMAVGSPPPAVDSADYRPATDMPQQEQMDGLPFGTRRRAVGQPLLSRRTRSTTFACRWPAADPLVAWSSSRSRSTVSRSSCSRWGTPTPPGHPPRARPRRCTPGTGPTTSASRWRPVHGTSGVAFYKKPTGLVEQVRELFDNPRIMGNPWSRRADAVDHQPDDQGSVRGPTGRATRRPATVSSSAVRRRLRRKGRARARSSRRWSVGRTEGTSRRGMSTSCWAFSSKAAPTVAALMTASSWRSAACSSARSSCTGSSRLRRLTLRHLTRPVCIASAT